jgi:hypothetical protein
MPNVRLFVGATPSLSSRAKGADPCNPGRFHSSQSSRVRDADADETARPAKPALVDQIDGPRRRSELPSTLSQLKQWKVRMGESDWGELADMSVIGA